MEYTFSYYVTSGAKCEDAPWIEFDEDISEKDYSLIIAAKKAKCQCENEDDIDPSVQIYMDEIAGLEDLYKSLYESVLASELDNINDFIDDYDIEEYLEENYTAKYDEDDDEYDDCDLRELYGPETVEKAKIEYFKDYYEIRILC